jgi:hypothetical protein
VFGVEADGDWADASGFGTFTASALCAGGCLTQNTWLSTARARVGYALDRFLVYGTGGAAFGNVRANFSNDPLSSTTEAGWTAGVEVALARNWSAKAEYTFSSSSPTGHAPLIALSQVQAEHPSFPTSPSSSARASSAAASITDSLGSRSGLPFSEAQGVGRSESNEWCRASAG